MKAVIFARVSTKDQEDGHSLDAQIQSCFEYAIKKEKVEVYSDPERGHLVQKMFEDYATGLYSMEDLRILTEKEGLRSKKDCKIAKSQIEKVKKTFYYGYMRYNDILYQPSPFEFFS